jgi:hypothetical protein
LRPAHTRRFSYYFQNTLHAEDAQWGQWNAIFAASFIPTFKRGYASTVTQKARPPARDTRRNGCGGPTNVLSRAQPTQSGDRSLVRYGGQKPWHRFLAVFEIVRKRPACFAFRYGGADHVLITDGAGLIPRKVSAPQILTSPSPGAAVSTRGCGQVAQRPRGK